MTRLVAVSTTSVLVSLGSFAVALVEDLRLGVPLPYSVPLAFAGVMATALALVIALEHLRVRPLVHVRIVHAPAARADTVPRRRPDAQGFVLLDLSRTAQSHEQAA
jgi:hypothetical protein